MKASRLVSLLIVAFAVTALSAPASAALNAYLKLTGQKQGSIKGSATQKGRTVPGTGAFSMDDGKTWVHVSSFAPPTSADASTKSAVSIALDLTAGSSAKVTLPESGDALPSIVVVSDNKRYAFSTVRVTSIAVGADDTESVAISYDKLSISDANLAIVPALHFAEDFAKAAPSPSPLATAKHKA